MLKKNDSSEETELCYQALASFDRYMQMLRERSMHDAKLESQLVCNGLPVLSFVKRYRTKAEVSTTSGQ